MIEHSVSQTPKAGEKYITSDQVAAFLARLQRAGDDGTAVWSATTRRGRAPRRVTKLTATMWTHDDDGAEKAWELRTWERIPAHEPGGPRHALGRGSNGDGPPDWPPPPEYAHPYPDPGQGGYLPATPRE